MSWLNATATLSVAALALLAGGLFIMLAGAVPTFRALPVRTWVRIHVGLDEDIKRFMPLITAVALLAGAASVAFPQVAVERVLRVLAVLALLAGIVVTIRVNHPVNRTVGALDTGGGPDDGTLTELRRTWIAGHRARTVASVFSLLFAVLALGWG